MGEKDVRSRLEGEQLRDFTQALLTDIRALERMLERGMLEEQPRRIGAEQEFFLVDQSWRPCPCALEVLEALDDPHFTTELALFNLEANLDPRVYGRRCLHEMEQQLNTLLARARSAASAQGAGVLLTGILPTIGRSDLSLENMTPDPRYRALNDALTGLRGTDYEFRIRGVDELLLRHDSVMVEACNASFQAHFQVTPREFPHLYNIAQVIAAPVLAAACNSPLLFGKRLWSETRIGLFEQAVDTRASRQDLRKRLPRVSFGQDWVQSSVLELYREDALRFRALLGGGDWDDPFELLERGEVPRLGALCLHNSTVYRWNRACYGITNGKPHLRIENRILPAGPTPLDEIANCALWFGLMGAFAERFPDVTRQIDFEDASRNFHAAAQMGLQAQFTWLHGETLPARRLLSERLIPMAREGLELGEVDGHDIDRYLGVIEARVDKGRTGSAWMLKSYARLRGQGSDGERLTAITAAIHSRQLEGRPVTSWELARLEEAGGWKHNYLRVEDFMTTDLFTVGVEEPIDLVANLMDWERIRHVLVENDEGELVGLISYRSLLRFLSRARLRDGEAPVAASQIMLSEPLSVAPSTSTIDAINLMRQHRIACLPVVEGRRLVGVITERHFLDITAGLIESTLRRG